MNSEPMHEGSGPTDEQIAKDVQAGDTEAFGALVHRYERKILRYAQKFLFNMTDAEDLVQEVFIKAYRNIQSFDAERKFSPWIYRIAHNVFINAIRSRRTEPLPFFDPDVIFPHPLSPATADRAANEQELRDMLNECLGRIDVKYREPLVLFYLQEMEYQEIAEVLHLPVSTVGVRLKRGRERLRKEYEQLHGRP